MVQDRATAAARHALLWAGDRQRARGSGGLHHSDPLRGSRGSGPDSQSGFATHESDADAVVAMSTVLKDGGIFDVMVLYDQNGNLLPHPITHRGVLVRLRNEMLIATDAAGNEVTTSLVMQYMGRVPRGGREIQGYRARGQNADSFATQGWVLFPAKMNE